MTAPFPQRGQEYASSSTDNTVHGGSLSFTLDNDRIDLPDGYMVQAEAETATDNYMVGAWSRTSATEGTLIVGTTQGKDFDWSVDNPTGAEIYGHWRLKVVDTPRPRIPFYQLNGLRVTINGDDPDHDIDISAGSVRDSTDTVDLVLTTAVTKKLDALFAEGTNEGAQVQSDDLAGTVSSAALNVTGTGTAFEDDFGSGGPGAATLTDLDDQLAQAGSIIAGRSIISAAGVTTCINVVGSDTALTTLTALGATDATYKRGGWVGGASDVAIYGVILASKDSNGTCHPFTTALTGSGEPDMPSADFVKYRVLGYVVIAAGSLVGVFGGIFGNIHQPLVTATQYGYDNSSSGLDAINIQDAIDEIASEATAAATQAQQEAATATDAYTSPGRQHFHPGHPKAVYSATVTPTVLGINASAVDTTAESVTFTTHGRTAGQSVTLTGTVPAGLTSSQGYYIGVVDANNLTFHLTRADAIAGTNKVNITGTTTGWSFRYLAYTLEFGYGMATVSPVGYTPGTTLMSIEFNLGVTLSAAVAHTKMEHQGILTVGTAKADNSVIWPFPSTITTVTVTYDGAAMGGIYDVTTTSWNVPATQNQQGVTAFKVNFEAKGDL